MLCLSASAYSHTAREAFSFQLPFSSQACMLSAAMLSVCVLMSKLFFRPSLIELIIQGCVDCEVWKGRTHDFFFFVYLPPCRFSNLFSFFLKKQSAMRACHTISSKLTSSLCRTRDLLNMEGLPVGKDLLMQNMFPLASGKQKDREPGGLGSSQRKQVPWSPLAQHMSW